MKAKQSFINSVKVAVDGVFTFFRKERNAGIELTIAVSVIVFSFLLKLSPAEWILILLCIAVVITLEMMNAALEKLCDLVNPGLNPKIKEIKDISAGAVLTASIVSVIIGTIIFLPKVIRLFF